MSVDQAPTAPSKTDPLAPDVVALRDAAIRWAVNGCIHRGPGRARCHCQRNAIARFMHVGFVLVDGGWTVEPPGCSDVAAAPFFSRLIGQWRRRDADRPWWLP
jgi:hypothetical protein